MIPIPGIAYHQKMETLPPRIARIRESMIACREKRACPIPMKQPKPGEWVIDFNRPSIYTEEESKALSQVMFELI